LTGLTYVRPLFDTVETAIIAVPT